MNILNFFLFCYGTSLKQGREREREREREQQDAAVLMFSITRLSQHVSGIISPIVRRTRLCTAAYGVQHCSCGAETQACDPAAHEEGQHNQC